MNLKPEIIDAMVASGCTAEQIAAVVKASLGRSTNAERQARYRERNKPSRVTDSNVTSVTHPSPSGSSPTPPSPNLQPIPPSPPKGGSSPDEIAIVVEAFAETAKRSGLSVPRSIDKRRRQAIGIRLRENGLPAVLEAITKIGASRFCCGENDRGWRADIDFLLQPKSFTALLEGKYDNRLGVKPQGRERTILDVIDERLERDNDIFGALRTIDIEPSRRESSPPDLRLVADASRH